jgi:hypothetical protein
VDPASPAEKLNPSASASDAPARGAPKRKRGRPRKSADDGVTMFLDFEGSVSSEEVQDVGTSAPRRPGRPPGAIGDKARERLVAQGAAVDDFDRPTDGRRRKVAGDPHPVRFGPGQPLNNRRLEDAARRIAGGMDELDALVLSGYSTRSLEYVKALRHPEFIARVGELRQADIEFAGPSLPFWLQRLMRIADADPALCFERDSFGRTKVRDILAMEPQARAAIVEYRYDKHGRPILKFHDRRQAIQDVIRSILPSRVEVSGPGGEPLNDLGLEDPAKFEADLAKILELKAEYDREQAALVSPAPAVDVEPANGAHAHHTAEDQAAEDGVDADLEDDDA